MKVKYCLLLGILIIWAAGCSPANSTSSEPSAESDGASSEIKNDLIYSGTADSPLYDYATSAPNIIYTTPAEENGLSGNPYFVSGTVVDVVSAEDSATRSRYFIVENENGQVYFADIIEYMFNNAASESEKELLELMYASDYNSPFPSKGETITAYGLYDGYSSLFDAPVFYFSLNENLQEAFSTDSDYDSEHTSAPDDTNNIDASNDTNENQVPEEESNPSTDMTMGQSNALSQAKSYLNITAFSYSGLIEQLEFEGYSTEDATFAVDNCGTDWNEQAAKKAESYLELMSFSRSGLIEQLQFEGFTSEQAEYGVTAVGY